MFGCALPADGGTFNVPWGSDFQKLPFMNVNMIRCSQTFCSPSQLWSRRRDHLQDFELPSFLSCSQFLAEPASTRMASYKRLNPEDVLLSCPGLAKEPSALQKEFSVSLDANL